MFISSIIKETNRHRMIYMDKKEKNVTKVRFDFIRNKGGANGNVERDFKSV